MTTPVDVKPNNDRELVLARVIDASPEALYRCWTDPAIMPKWFCPKPWTIELTKQELKAGGASEMIMRGPNGEEFPNKGVYLELVPNRKIVFTDVFTEGWVPVEGGGMMTATVTFERQADGKTLYIARCGHPTAEKKAQHEQMGFHEGWGIVAEQLEETAKALETV
jgi:uncharacterized protein YndB with AHSA1/START domain